MLPTFHSRASDRRLTQTQLIQHFFQTFPELSEAEEGPEEPSEPAEDTMTKHKKAVMTTPTKGKGGGKPGKVRNMALLTELGKPKI